MGREASSRPAAASTLPMRGALPHPIADPACGVEIGNGRLIRTSHKRGMSTALSSGSIRTAPAASIGFLPALELLRFVCAFGIVWYHMQGPHKVLFHFALPLFVMLAVFLSVISLQRGGERRFWKSRLKRVLVPWLAWSAFYILVETLRGEPSFLTQLANNPLMILVGPTITLWFLPFLLIASLVVAVVVRWMDHKGDVEWLMMIAAPVAACAFWAYNHATLPTPLVLWCSIFPSVLYGLVMIYARERARPWAPVLFLAAVVAMSMALNSLSGTVATLFAAAIFEIGLRARLKGSIWLLLGQLSFGIYLMHPFVMLLYYKFADFGWPPAIGALIVFAASAIGTAIMLRLPVARALV